MQITTRLSGSTEPSPCTESFSAVRQSAKKGRREPALELDILADSYLRGAGVAGQVPEISRTDDASNSGRLI
jgi:hypothetical protein